MREGNLVACATGGEGSDSITETSIAVESGSHDENSAVRIARGSRDRLSCGGRVIPRDLVIFSVMTGSLWRERIRRIFHCIEYGTGESIK